MSRLYPDIAFNLASAIRQGTFERGLLFCGTGIGMAIVANKVPGHSRPRSVMTFTRPIARAKAIMHKL
nr:ribose 5-phosphate isomerase B [Raoultella sp. NCTC 9187]